MIEFKPHDNWSLMDPDLRAKADAEGWIKLSLPMHISEEDFAICAVRIGGIVYREATPEFWEVYKKAKVWDKLNG